MKIFTASRLTHTLQTDHGMVVNYGKPQHRQLPSMPSYLTSNEKFQISGKDPTLLSVFALCVLECRLPDFADRYEVSDSRRFEANIYACCDLRVGIVFMKGILDSLLRLDLEQAAAVVISAIRNDSTVPYRTQIVQALLEEIDPYVLDHSCMWLEYSGRNSAKAIQTKKFADLASQIRRIIQSKHMTDMGEITDWSSLLPFLIRIRRCFPRSRCLFIPEWIFRNANTAPSPEFCIWDSQGRVQPGHEPCLSPVSDSIILTRKEYLVIQRRLLRHFRFWDPAIVLRTEIKDLEAKVIHGAEIIRSHVMTSNHTLVVAHYFFALQRRLQRKVVSDLSWTGFLAKGESGNILQNNPDILTTFEQCLGAFSAQEGIPLSGPLLPQIDRCCLLMEAYVRVHGDGDRNNLVFVPGVGGGLGRGPVDQYNLLVDVLDRLCKAAREERIEVPGPVRKFLAKDIMAWNGAFGDDAFAGRTVPEWERWLADRRERGLVGGLERMRL